MSNKLRTLYAGITALLYNESAATSALSKSFCPISWSIFHELYYKFHNPELSLIK